LNRLAANADLLVSEGFIEPHFFAGFSGGRKSVLPGVSSRSTVLYNHNAGFINDKNSASGVLEGNPIHRDMVYAAQKAGLTFICNVVLDPQKNIIHAVSGGAQEAHEEGCGFLSKLCTAEKSPRI
jgi:nickel-dependent lactate racemase